MRVNVSRAHAAPFLQENKTLLVSANAEAHENRYMHGVNFKPVK